jgi:biotin carboxyl carrier protein
LKSIRQFESLIDQQWVAISLEALAEGYLARLPHGEMKLDVAVLGKGHYSLLTDGLSFDVTIHRMQGHYQVTVNGNAFEVVLRDPRQMQHQAGEGADSDGPASVSAPMPGKLVRLLVAEGEPVSEGQGVAVVEAMKMQNELRAPKAGIVEKIRVAEGQAVNGGECLLTIQ